MANPQTRAGQYLLDENILAWAQEVHVSDPTVSGQALQRAFQSPSQHNIPPIQIGPLEAGLLRWLVASAGAKTVVEIGTLAGYSAIAMAQSLPEHGSLWTLELDPAHAAIARDNLEAAKLPCATEVLVGPATDSLASLAKQGPFDVVFVDADKESYPAYGRWAAQNLAPGGLLIADNVFLFGQLLDSSPVAQAMREFHQQVTEHFHTACIPTPDGLLVGRRRKNS